MPPLTTGELCLYFAQTHVCLPLAVLMGMTRRHSAGCRDSTGRTHASRWCDRAPHNLVTSQCMCALFHCAPPLTKVTRRCPPQLAVCDATNEQSGRMSRHVQVVCKWGCLFLPLSQALVCTYTCTYKV